MTTRPLETHELHFRTPSRLGLVRDVLIVALWLALTVGFLAQVWHGPVPAGNRSPAEAATSPDAPAAVQRG